MRINQKYPKKVVPLQHGKEYQRDIGVPAATQGERLGDRISPYRGCRGEHIRQSSVCQARCDRSGKDIPYIRLQARTDLETFGFVAVQDLHHGPDTAIQSRCTSVERGSSLGRRWGAHDRTARKKTIDVLRNTKSQSATAKLLRLSRDQVHHVMERAVAFGLQHRSKTHIYKHLSIDEKSVHGRDFASILYDNETGVVLEVEDGRKEESVNKLLDNALTPIQLANAETFSMDMWEPFIKTVSRRNPFAHICHDLYHLVSYLNKGVDEVRRREVKKHQELRRTRYLFLKDTESLTDKQHYKFDSIIKMNYEVAQAWRIKEEFRDLIKVKNDMDVRMLYLLWKQRVKNAHIPEMTKIVEMFERHDKGIRNAFAYKRNNGRAERMNGSIQELQTVGRGYCDVAHFRTAVLFFHGGLALHKDMLIQLS